MNERIKYLLEQYFNHAATVEEERELATWSLADENRQELELLLKDLWEQTKAGEEMGTGIAKDIFLKIIGKNRAKVPIVHWKRLVAAASIIAIIGIGVYFYTSLSKNNSAPAITTVTSKDIPAPAANRAIITLADGSRVYLDSVGDGQLAQQGNIKLMKLSNGQIAYQTASGEMVKEIQFNTLTNPKGSKVINMALADGSRVWLNAGSSVTYPVVFVGNERKVELKGEGYFEVAKDPSKKFIVSANSTTTEVLGTHFNINAYEDEEAMRVTLLEGSVIVSNPRYKNKVTLRPGQQAALDKTDADIKLSRADLDQVLAWKTGFFTFNDLSFDEVMKKIERWYDIKVVYARTIPNINLEGDLSKNTSLNGALEALRFQGVDLKLEGRTVTVY